MKKLLLSIILCVSIALSFPNTINLINGGDEVMINEAVEAVKENGTVNILSGDWVLDSGIVIDKDINFIMQPGAWIIYNNPGIAVDFQTDIVRKEIKINVSRTTDWTTGNEGVKLRYTIGSDIHINAIGFEKGLHLESNHGYLAYNRIFLSDIWNCQYAVFCYVVGGNGVSRNLFIGGRISVAGTVNPTLDRYGIYIKGGSINQGIGCEITLAPGTSGGNAYPIYFNNTNGNQFHQYIIEGGTNAMKCVGTSKGNRIHGAVGSIEESEVLDESTQQGTNRIINTDGYNFVSEVFSENDLVSKAVVDEFYQPARPYYIIPGFTFCNKSTGDYSLKHLAYVNEICLQIESSHAIGKLVKTDKVKDFLFSGPNDGSIIVNAYDNNGNRVDSGVVGLTYNGTLFGGCFITSLFGEVFFHVSDSIKSIWVGYEPDNQDGYIEITTLSLRCDGKIPVSNPGYNLIVEGKYNLTDNISSVGVPLGGVFNNGTKILNLSPSVGDTPEWIVTDRQTKSTTEIETEGETNISVNDVDGISDGDIVGVIINNGTKNEWFWSTVSNTIPGYVILNNAIPTGCTVQIGSKLITYKINELAALSPVTIH